MFFYVGIQVQVRIGIGKHELIHEFARVSFLQASPICSRWPVQPAPPALPRCASAARENVRDHHFIYSYDIYSSHTEQLCPESADQLPSRTLKP